MLTLLLPTLYVLEPVTGCMAGVKFVPPSSLVIQPVRRTPSTAPQSESSPACVPCRRDGPSESQSPRFLWPAATTSAPCCPVTDSSTTTTTTTTTTFNYLTNATGENKYYIISLHFPMDISNSKFIRRLWCGQH